MTRSRRCLATLAVGATLSLGGLGRAQEAPDELTGIADIEEVDLAELLGSVTAVSRREESVFTAPAAVTVLDQAALRSSGATSIADLLRTVPGVQVLETSPGNYLVSLRGTGGVTGNNLVVLLDGIPLNSRVDASVDWGLVPVDPHQIDRIEIVRGPVSTIYGANAYTGVINIVSLAPPGHGVRATAHVEAGVDSSGRPFGSSSIGVGGATARWRWRLTLDGAYDGLYADGAGGLQPALRKVGATAFVEVRLRHDLTLGLRLAGGVGDHSSADHLVLESFPLRSSQGLGELRLIWRSFVPIVDNLQLWARARYQAVDTDASLYHGFSPDGMRGFDTELGVDVHFKLPKGFSADLGASSGWSAVSAPYLHPDVSGKVFAQYGYYASVGVDVLKRLVLVLGVRGDASAFLDGIVRSYRGSIIYRRRLWSIRLSAGSAYRAPSYIEAAARFIDPATGLVVLEGTPSLSAPGIESFEVGAIVLIAQRLTLRPTLYLQRMSNLIVEDFGSLTRKTFTNDPNTRVVLGGELEAELKIRAGLAMEASFAGMYFRPADDGGQQPTVGVAQQNSAITAHVGIRGSLLGDRLGLSFGVLYTSPRSYDLRTGIPPAALQLDVPSLVRLDAAAQYRLTRRRPLTIYLKARSRLPHGVQDSPIPGASTIGTSVVLGLEYRGD